MNREAALEEEVNRLRGKLREAREEIAEYERRGIFIPMEGVELQQRAWCRKLGLPLSPVRLLFALMSHPGRVLDYDTLVRAMQVRADDRLPRTAIVDVRVCGLRKRLRLLIGDQVIRNERGHGFVIDAGPAARLRAWLERGDD